MEKKTELPFLCFNSTSNPRTDAPSFARRAINSWVSGKCDNCIPELLPSGSIGRTTFLLLVNVVYFDAKWYEPFKVELTRSEAFRREWAPPVDVRMMRACGSMGYFENDEVQIVSLDYNGPFCMYVILPKRFLWIYEDSMREKDILAWMDECRSANRKVELSLPKFKIDVTPSIREILKSKGIYTAFDAEAADFSGLAGDGLDLYVNSLVHSVSIEVDEAGTRAVAGISLTMLVLGIDSSEPVVFKADHPFIFIISPKDTPAILFMGRVTDPTK